ncbi:uncharacterized protein N7483_001441 [Penicillium malachiteum]|uniref:uncharacterized protein n=1 Tax=Penicillium malachiteum TaxID=1324776 RepID=UPI002547AE2F|nr:uncharacterized protein N7483_001441 [Penicillium malachiteum]KAJ5736316.1 hypothetical protein N7483_001441 [Penicillium malachiteum]
MVMPAGRVYRHVHPEEVEPPTKCTALMLAAQVGNTPFFEYLLGLAHFATDVGQHESDSSHLTVVNYALRCRNTVEACVMVARLLRWLPNDAHLRSGVVIPGLARMPFTNLWTIHGYVLCVMGMLHFRLEETYDTFTTIGAMGALRFLNRVIAECRHHQMLIRQIYLFMAPGQSAGYFAGPQHAMVLGRAAGLGGPGLLLNTTSVFDVNNFRMPLTAWRPDKPH